MQDFSRVSLKGSQETVEYRKEHRTEDMPRKFLNEGTVTGWGILSSH